jgi:O-antigen/teichoic acid export membrane protein
MLSKVLINNILSNYLGMVVNIIVAFLISPYLILKLGDSDYGIWTIIAAFTGYMSLMDLGLNSAINRFTSKFNALNDSQSINSVYSNSVLMFSVIGFFILLLSPFFSYYFTLFMDFTSDRSGLVQTIIYIVCFDVALFVVGGLFRGFLGGMQRYGIINLIQIISAINKAIMFYIFLELEYGLVGMAYASLIANFLSFLLFLFITHKLYIKIKFDPSLINKKMMSDLINFSKLTFLAMLANQVIFYSDTFIIASYLTLASVTYYSISWSLVEYIKKIAISFSRSFSPAISALDAQGDFEQIKGLFLIGTKYSMIIVNLFALGFIILGGFFIAVWIGPKYKELCETVLIILFFNLIIIGPQQVSYALLQGMSLQKSYTYYNSIVAVTNIVLSIFLVQKLGIIGVAIGTTVPQVIFNGLIVPALTLRAIKLDWVTYLKATYLRILMPSFCLIMILEMLTFYSEPHSYFSILSYGFIATIGYFVAVYIWSLDKSEKNGVVLSLKNFSKSLF